MNTFKNKTPNAQKGFTLIELVVVIAIAMSLIYWVMGNLVAPAQGKEKVGIASFDVSAIVNGSTDWVQGRAGGYTGISISLLTDDIYISESYSTGVGANPWQGNYTVTAGATPYTLVVAVTGMPESACARLAAKSAQAICAGTTTTYTISAT